jgi:hypothetical protein
MPTGNDHSRLRGACVRVLVLLTLMVLGACEAPPAMGPASPTPAPGGAPATATLTLPTATPPPAATATPAPTPSRDAGEANPPAAPSATPDRGIDLAVWSKHEQSPAGRRVTYRVHYANLDLEREAAEVVLDVALPEGAELAQASRATQPLADGTVQVVIGAVPPATGGHVDLDISWPDVPAPGSWASLTAKIDGAAPDPDETNNVSQDGERIAGPDLSLQLGLTDRSGPCVPGAAVSLQLSYRNAARARAPEATISVSLPPGMAYQSASGSLAGEPTVAETATGTLVTLPLRAVEANASNMAMVNVVLADDLQPDQALTWTAEISASGEIVTADNRAEATQIVQVPGPDLWIALDQQGDSEMGGQRVYRLRYGNRGTDQATDVNVSLALPEALEDVRYSIAPTATDGAAATWQVGKVANVQVGKEIEITGTIAAEGSLAASARIAASGADANPRNDVAEAAIEAVALAMPLIEGPDQAVVGAQPRFHGQGRPAATVSLILAPSEGQPGQPLGTAVVDGNGRWELTPEVALVTPGWHWFLATQELGGQVSATSGVANYYDPDTAIDPSSLTVDGKPVSGIDQAIAWPAGRVLTLGARIVACDAPQMPVLEVAYYDAAERVLSREVIEPATASNEGGVTFKFRVPRAEQEVQWQIALSYYCQVQGQTGAPQGTLRWVRYTVDLMDDIKRKIECLFGCDPKPKSPPPPQPCEGCTPLDRKPKKKPNPFNAPDDVDWVYAPGGAARGWGV